MRVLLASCCGGGDEEVEGVRAGRLRGRRGAGGHTGRFAGCCGERRRAVLLPVQELIGQRHLWMSIDVVSDYVFLFGEVLVARGLLALPYADDGVLVVHAHVVLQTLGPDDLLVADGALELGMLVLYVQLQRRPDAERVVAARMVAHELGLFGVVLLDVVLESAGSGESLVALLAREPLVAVLVRLGHMRLERLVLVEGLVALRALERLEVRLLVPLEVLRRVDALAAHAAVVRLVSVGDVFQRVPLQMVLAREAVCAVGLCAHKGPFVIVRAQMLFQQRRPRVRLGAARACAAVHLRSRRRAGSAGRRIACWFHGQAGRWCLHSLSVQICTLSLWLYIFPIRFSV